jgi:hypothetical protein
MAEQITFKVPRVNVRSVLEFIVDAIILIVVFNIAGSFFLAKDVPLQEQLTGLFSTIGVTAIAVKYVLSTKIVPK